MTLDKEDGHDGRDDGPLMVNGMGVVRKMDFKGHAEDLKLDGMFNTFRIGYEWASLKPGNPLYLNVIDPDEDEDEVVDIKALVFGVDHGTLMDMLDKHIGMNHQCKNTQASDMRVELRKVLNVMYGRRVGVEERCTVVYIHRIQDEI